MSHSRFSRPRISWLLLAALLSIGLSTFRAIYLENVASTYTSCRGCFLMPALGHDAWLVAGVLGVLGLAMLAPGRWLRLFLRLSAALLIAAQAIDLLLFRLFTQRLYLADVLRFSGDVSAVWSVARAQFFSANGTWYLALLTLLILVGLLVDARRARRWAWILFAGALAVGIFAAVMRYRPLRYVNKQYVWNVIGVNLPEGRSHKFSAGFEQAQVRLANDLPKTCAPGTALRRNIIIVITESLSSYQSALLGGPHDWLPRLDAMARANHYFTHFYANGFTTDGGEDALLTGRVPMVPPGYDSYSDRAFGPGPDTVPGIAHRAGYTTQFFTAVSLKFLDAGTWLHRLKFDTVEGSEGAFYKDKPRGQFGAAPDRALFERYEQWLDRHTDARPFVSVLLTISSHPPFVDPRTGKIDPPKSFGYVDAQIADFYDALKQRGFFNNGVLLITGDHHAMTPILPQEFKHFGERAFSRIPLIVAGAVDMPNVVTASFQQSDFPASLAYIMGVNYCRTPFQGIFLAAKPEPPTYVVQARGDNRNRVDVYFDDQVASYLEQGDSSHWMNATRPPHADQVAAWINAQRLRNVPAAPH